MKFGLIYSYDPAQTGPTQEEFPDWMALEQALKDAGVLVYDCGFYPALMAEPVRVRVRDGAATTEQGTCTGDTVAGFVVVEVDTIDEAVKWAGQIPTATYGQVEVRQLVEM